MGIDLPYRNSIRLNNFDYSSIGAYFVTICAEERENIFGQIKNGQVVLNDIGKMIDSWWHKLDGKYPWVKLENYIIMPDHIHGIICFVGAIPCNRPCDDKIPCNRPQLISHCKKYAGENMISPLPIQNSYNGIGQMISWFKRMSTNEYIRNVEQKYWPHFNKRFWQRNYYEHIIRDEQDLYRIKQYIADNPINWENHQ